MAFGTSCGEAALEPAPSKRVVDVAFEASSAEMALYAPANLTHPKTRPQEVTLIPYYVWANRQPCAMQVWVPYMRT